MNKKYILFDLDGTVTNSMEGITKSVQYALRKYGIEVSDLNELRKFIGPPLKDSFMEFYNFTEEDAEKGITYYREYFTDKGIFENYPYEGIDKLLDSLKSAGKKIILATSKPEVFSKRILDHFDLTKYFDYIAGSTLDGSRSSKGDVIRYALKESNITDLDSTIMIGDRLHDIEGAKACKIESIGVLYGFGDRKELEEAGADFIVNDINELEKLLLS